MASGMSSNPGLVRKLLNAIGGKVGADDSGSGGNDRIARLGLSERQQHLNRLWGWYRGAQYDARGIDWNGRQVMDPIAVEAISSKGFIPPGFVDAGNSDVPLKFRKPTAPYGLAKVIVERFTGLLFSEQNHPQIAVEGDPVTEDYVRALADVSRVWQQMILARTYGGATGSVAVGFQFIDGRPVIEVHDPRWCTPQFVERTHFTLKSIEKRYQYPIEVRDPETGRFETVAMWYRRVITDVSDTVFKPVPVENGKEPEWEVESEVAHNFGFCPVVWVQNLPVQDDVDGDPDCHGTFATMESIDQLVAQAHRAILANCDPTLVITTDSEMGPEIQKGVGKALRIPKGDAKYLEMTASGSKAAIEMAAELRKMVLEVCQCVLEQPEMANRTATEVERNFSSMLAKADVLREQYGERCVRPLLEMMFKAASALAKPIAQTDPTTGAPTMVRRELSLPPTYVTDPATGALTEIQRTPGSGGVIRLKWPGYFRPGLADVELAVRSAGAAKDSGIVDSKTLGNFIAPYFNADDPEAMTAAAQSEFDAKQAQLEAQMLAQPQSKWGG